MILWYSVYKHGQDTVWQVQIGVRSLSLFVYNHPRSRFICYNYLNIKINLLYTLPADCRPPIVLFCHYSLSLLYVLLSVPYLYIRLKLTSRTKNTPIIITYNITLFTLTSAVITASDKTKRQLLSHVTLPLLSHIAD